MNHVACCISVVASAIANGTFTSRAIVFASSVLPVPAETDRVHRA